MKGKIAAAAALAAVLASAALVTSARAKSKEPAPAPADAPAAAVSVAAAKTVKSAPREELTGTLQPAKALQLGFEVAGRLARIAVRKGQPVAEGQIIASLDTELADAQVMQAEAAVKAAEAQAALAADNASRQTELSRSGSVSEFQQKSSSSNAATAAAQLQAAKAQLAAARATRRKHDLKAPFAGVLIDAPDQIGATVAAGATLFTLEQLDPLVLKITVSEAARAAVKPGTKVHVDSVTGGISRDDAFVRTVIPSADAVTRRIPVEIQVPNKDGRLTAHTLGRAVLSLGSEEDALALPASALSSQGGDHVYAVNGASEVRRVPVEVLDRGREQVVVRVREPLTSVVDYPAPDLKDGTRVSVR
jgi:RND family efflux transporter MFP subunit